MRGSTRWSGKSYEEDGIRANDSGRGREAVPFEKRGKCIILRREESE